MYLVFFSFLSPSSCFLTHLYIFFFFSFAPFSSPLLSWSFYPSILNFLLFMLFFQRQVLRPGTAFSVRLRSWWRRSSRLPAYGRVRTTAEECSSPMKTLEAEPAVATAPWCREHTHAQTHAYTRSNIHT